MPGRKAAIAACITALAMAVAPAAQADAPVSDTVVCNEAENSPRGGYEVTGGPVDPVPPAFLRGSTMRVGGGAGLVNAAEHSPALRVCSVEDGEGGGGGGPSAS